MFAEQFANVRTKSPLIHNITNYVTVNDCANMVLACGASPIMADDAAEVEDITTICGGLNINIGTLNSRTIESMLKAGKKANALGHPVVLDPVGAGASALRTETAYPIGHDVNGTGNGHNGTGLCGKCLGKGHRAVQIFLGDPVGHIGIHALGGARAGGQRLYLGDVAPDDREPHLVQQAVGLPLPSAPWALRARSPMHG